MNYDLAIMALEGLARSPIQVQSELGAVRIEGSAASLKELARLLLLLAGEGGSEDAIDLQKKVHVTADSLELTIRTR